MKRRGKQIWQDVAVACIYRNGKYLIGKRPQSRGGLWEFPGGKKERGESIPQALKREILEEIGVEVSVRPPFHVEKVEDRARERRWRLYFCRCRIVSGRPKKTEHTALRWVKPQALFKQDFPEANRKAVARLLRIGR